MVKEELHVICDCKIGELKKIAKTKNHVSGPSERYRVASVVFYECNSCEQLFERTEVEEHRLSDVIPRHGEYIPYRRKLTKQELENTVNRLTPYEFSIMNSEKK